MASRRVADPVPAAISVDGVCFPADALQMEVRPPPLLEVTAWGDDGPSFVRGAGGWIWECTVVANKNLLDAYLKGQELTLYLDGFLGVGRVVNCTYTGSPERGGAYCCTLRGTSQTQPRPDSPPRSVPASPQARIAERIRELQAFAATPVPEPEPVNAPAYHRVLDFEPAKPVTMPITDAREVDL